MALFLSTMVIRAGLDEARERHLIVKEALTLWVMQMPPLHLTHPERVYLLNFRY